MMGAMATTAELAGEAITKRMAHEGVNQVQLARKADVSDVLIRELQQGIAKRRQPDKLARISTALRWSTDSIDRLLNGEAPIEMPSEIPDGVSYRVVSDETVVMLERMGELVGELTERARTGRL